MFMNVTPVKNVVLLFSSLLMTLTNKLKHLSLENISNLV
jgi:hypothetical protein